MRLDITVNGKNVGHLTQTGINAYIFEYAENVNYPGLKAGACKAAMLSRTG